MSGEEKKEDVHVIKVMSSYSYSVTLEFRQKNLGFHVYDYISQLTILVHVRGVTQVKITNLVYISTLIMLDRFRFLETTLRNEAK